MAFLCFLCIFFTVVVVSAVAVVVVTVESAIIFLCFLCVFLTVVVLSLVIASAAWTGATETRPTKAARTSELNRVNFFMGDLSYSFPENWEGPNIIKTGKKNGGFFRSRRILIRPLIHRVTGTNRGSTIAEVRRNISLRKGHSFLAFFWINPDYSPNWGKAIFPLRPKSIFYGGRSPQPGLS